MEFERPGDLPGWAGCIMGTVGSRVLGSSSVLKSKSQNVTASAALILIIYFNLSYIVHCLYISRVKWQRLQYWRERLSTFSRLAPTQVNSCLWVSSISTAHKPCQLHSHPINTDNMSVAPQDLNSSLGQSSQEHQEKVISTWGSVQTKWPHSCCRFRQTEEFLVCAHCQNVLLTIYVRPENEHWD